MNKYNKEADTRQKENELDGAEPFLIADFYPASQKTLPLWSPNVHYRVHNSQQKKESGLRETIKMNNEDGCLLD
jgi:hypothetical protein